MNGLPVTPTHPPGYWVNSHPQAGRGLFSVPGNFDPAKEKQTIQKLTIAHSKMHLINCLKVTIKLESKNRGD